MVFPPMTTRRMPFHLRYATPSSDDDDDQEPGTSHRSRHSSPSSQVDIIPSSLQQTYSASPLSNVSSEYLTLPSPSPPASLDVNDADSEDWKLYSLADGHNASVLDAGLFEDFFGRLHGENGKEMQVEKGDQDSVRSRAASLTPENDTRLTTPEEVPPKKSRSAIDWTFPWTRIDPALTRKTGVRLKKRRPPPPAIRVGRRRCVLMD
ncbi:uncharacterized protein LOC129593429 [Paramacrobiotus metropolitanus]|uniref:uncharacterized protein LOC129593429 n=1 Tax=Paramacrobiotus metropolitanus TaxID=2943436 RepID=UPI002445C889|nr:uncharacterized protein LOC129593429 [Paramacrobiotus metropolitanus]